MNDKWLNDLRNKMEGHTENVPEGLWNEIEQELFHKEKGKIIPLFSAVNQPEVTSKKTKWKRITAVAASVAILLSAGLFVWEKENKIIIEQTPVVTNSQKEIEAPNKGQNIIVKDQKSTNSLVFSNDGGGASSPNTSISKKVEEIVSSSGYNEMRNSENQVLASTVQSLKNNGDIVQDFIGISEKKESDKQVPMVVHAKDDTDIEKLLKKEEKELFVINNDKPKKNLKNRSLRLLSGQFSPNSSQQYNGYALMSGQPMEEPVASSPSGGDDPLNDILVGNQDQDVGTKIRHKTPVRFGLSFNYNLGNRWAVSSGVTYTKLSSELFSGSESYNYKSEQVLHYVGVPIQINYNIWSKGRFKTYANAGVNIEKAVAGNLKTNYIVDNNTQETRNERININQLQFSVNSGLGIEYKLSEQLGLYFEPGIRYHFDDKSSIYTIYKEKPLNFNLQFGLRLDIGK